MKHLLFLAALPAALFAQTLDGTWQGTLTTPNNQEVRLVFQIAKNGAAYQGTFHNLENRRQFTLGAVTLQGNTVKVAIPGNGLSYEGKIEPDGKSIIGAINPGSGPMRLVLNRATTETAWELPPPPTAPRGLPEGTKLEFEVASIKPVPEGQPRGGFSVSGRQFRARGSSLVEFLAYAFNLHPKQISGVPGWGESDRYAIVATLPQGGEPNDVQLLKMLQNLILSRFDLSFHNEKREQSVYTIGLGKGGAAGIKMVKNDTSGLSVGGGPGRVRFRGAAMSDLAKMLQVRVLPRPVIDQSGLTGRYDFTLQWTPDEFQFPDLTPAQRAAIPAGADGSPDLFTAVREQLGLKLESTKAAIDVFVIDKVSRPSEN
jgi:uncharacterized protein (TIGR03435 family)